MGVNKESGGEGDALFSEIAGRGGHSKNVEYTVLFCAGGSPQSIHKARDAKIHYTPVFDSGYACALSWKLLELLDLKPPEEVQSAPQFNGHNYGERESASPKL